MRITATAHAPWQAVLDRLARTLREKGFEARRTFDLQLARQSLPSGDAEPCPHHGAAPCDCQYLVLQIVCPGWPSSAVVIHGHDEETTVSLLPGGGDASEQEIAAAVHEAVEHTQAARDAGSRTSGRSPGESGAHLYAGVGERDARKGDDT